MGVIEGKPRSRDLAKEETRIALIRAGRRAFAEKGYHGAGTSEIVALAGVSRGALQHHFARKKDLFLAVINEVERDWVATLSAAGATEDEGTWASLSRRMDEYLRSALSPEIRRIVLIDGPAVLDWAEWRELGARYGMVGMERMLLDGMARGKIERQPVRPLADLILAVLYEAALIVAHAGDTEQARTALRRALNSIIVP